MLGLHHLFAFFPFEEGKSYLQSVGMLYKVSDVYMSPYLQKEGRKVGLQDKLHYMRKTG